MYEISVTLQHSETVKTHKTRHGQISKGLREIMKTHGTKDSKILSFIAINLDRDLPKNAPEEIETGSQNPEAWTKQIWEQQFTRGKVCFGWTPIFLLSKKMGITA